MASLAGPQIPARDPRKAGGPQILGQAAQPPGGARQFTGSQVNSAGGARSINSQANSALAPPVGGTGNRTAGSQLVQPSLGGGASRAPVRPEIPGDRNIPGGAGPAPSGPVNSFVPTSQQSATATARNVPLTSDSVPIPQFDRNKTFPGGSGPRDFAVNPPRSDIEFASQRGQADEEAARAAGIDFNSQAFIDFKNQRNEQRAQGELGGFQQGFGEGGQRTLGGGAIGRASGGGTGGQLTQQQDAGIPQQLFDPQLDARLRDQVFNPAEQQRFDPNTGQPIAGPDVQQQGQFDPNTGQPIAGPNIGERQQFDPTTGQPIAGPGGQQRGQFGPRQSALQGQLTGALQQQLSNPSGFSGKAGAGRLRQLSDELERSFSEQRSNIDADAAGRGVFFSTAPLKGKSRLASDQARQLRGFASDIGIEQAKTQGADTARAIGQAQGEAGRGFGEQLQQFGAQQGAGAQQFGQQLAGAQFGQQQQQQGFQNQLQNFLANQGAGQQQFGQELAGAQFGQGQQQQSFQNQLQNFLTNQGAGQQRFGQQLAAGQFGQGQQGQQFGQDLQGFLANQGAAQQQQNIQSQQLGDLQQQRGQATQSQLAANQQLIQQQQFQDQLALQSGALGLQGGPDQNQILRNQAALAQRRGG